MWESRRINLLADEGDAQGGKGGAGGGGAGGGGAGEGGGGGGGRGGAGGVEDDEGIIKTREQGGATPSVLGCD